MIDHFKDIRVTPELISSVPPAHLHWRWPVSVAEHRVQGMSKVVGLRTVVLLRQGQQEGKDHQQEQEELERQRHPEDAPQKRGPAS